jgi:hypothetical protein
MLKGQFINIDAKYFEVLAGVSGLSVVDPASSLVKVGLSGRPV